MAQNILFAAAIFLRVPSVVRSSRRYEYTKVFLTGSIPDQETTNVIGAKWVRRADRQDRALLLTDLMGRRTFPKTSYESR
ncbi:unnamed protein product, partial [Dicrocoelium dendriticum]